MWIQCIIINPYLIIKLLVQNDFIHVVQSHCIQETHKQSTTHRILTSA